MGLPWHIKALLDTGAYPEQPEKVELRQTHISYLFFTDLFVYKIKKPVDFGFLDFTTLDKRRYYCAEEVRLNKRLAPGVYAGVVEVVSKDGKAFIGAEGEAVDYAVKMKRLPKDTMLESMLERGAVREDTIRRVARAVASFHKRAETNPYISRFGAPEAIGRNTRENFSQTADFIGNTISPGLYGRIKSYTEDFISENKGLFLRRVDGGFIKDCHGDIHLEHVSISDGIDIIDCIEFNERFRFSDVVADIAFLSMDLDYHNRADLSRPFDEEYFSASGDAEGVRLLPFYKSYRAYVRGKVEGFKSLEGEVSEEDRGLAALNAIHHFHLSGLYAEGGFRPIAVIICGLSGAGKSRVAKALAEIFNMDIVSSDAVRKELAGVPPDEHRFEEYKKGIYSDEFTDKTYSALIRRGVERIRKNRSVIFDATFSKGRYLEEAKGEVYGAGGAGGAGKSVDLHVIECIAPEGTIKENFSRRAAEEQAGKAVLSDALWGVYLRQKAAFEPLKIERLTVDTTQPLYEVILRISRKIFD